MQAIPLVEFTPPTVFPMAALLRLTPPALQALIAQVHQDADLGPTYMQMAHVFMLSNQHEAAAQMQARALQHQRLYRIASERTPSLRLLVIMGPGNMQNNTPIEFVLDGSDIQTDILFLLPGEAFPQTLPQHDIAFIAVGESDKNAPLLALLETQMERWPRPVINRPQAIPHCARDSCYQLLKSIPGVYMARTQRLSPGDALDMDFPITLRPIDTQGGEGLQRINSVRELAAYYADHPAPAYYAAQYVDYQSADGLFRKLRIVLIDGEPFICHLAISGDWMVHYLSAGMELSESKRTEEAAAMVNFEQDFGLRHGASLREISRRLGLDYAVLDCAQTSAGRLLLFEVDSRAWVHSTDDVALFPYKPAVMQKAYDAFRAMLWERMATP